MEPRARGAFELLRAALPGFHKCACGQQRRPNQRTCRHCHAAYMRTWTKRHPRTGEARRRNNARNYANVYKRRGKLVPEPCVDCGSGEVQMHHEDYDKPLEVTWLCRPCHLARHRR